MTKTNPFAMYAGTETKTAVIKALNGATITYRELSLAENDAFTKRLIKDFGKDGSNATIDFDQASEIKYEKVALILVEPKMTVKELKALRGTGAGDAITEITALVEKEKGVDDKGN